MALLGQEIGLEMEEYLLLLDDLLLFAEPEIESLIHEILAILLGLIKHLVGV